MTEIRDRTQAGSSQWMQQSIELVSEGTATTERRKQESAAWSMMPRC
jgi:hypothetical protein